MMRTVIVIGMMIVAPLVGANPDDANDSAAFEPEFAAALAASLLSPPAAGSEPNETWVLDRLNQVLDEIPVSRDGLACAYPGYGQRLEFDKFSEGLTDLPDTLLAGRGDVFVGPSTRGEGREVKYVTVMFGWENCGGFGDPESDDDDPYIMLGDPNAKPIGGATAWAGWAIS